MGLLFEKAKTGFLNPVNKGVDGLISASNGLMCLKNAIMGAFMSPASILAGLGLAAAAMVNAIVSSVTGIITKRVNQMIDSILSPIRLIEGIISELTNDLNNILLDTQNLIDRVGNINNYFNDKQNCSTMAAQLLNCLAQSAINKITNKVAMDVDKNIGKIADSVSQKALGVNGIIAGHVDRHTKFVEKAQLQNKLLT